MKRPFGSPFQRRLIGAGCSVVIGLLGLALPVAAQSGDPAAASEDLDTPPPPPPPAPQLLSVGPTADSVQEKTSFEAPNEDGVSLNLSAGGAFAFGNTRAYQVSAGGDFRWVGKPHSVSANALWLMGGARLPGASAMVDTTDNINARAKYEIFLSEKNSLFAAAGFRRDRFAGMLPRLNGQVGYGRYFVLEEKARFWGEIGYDVMYTRYRELPGQAMDFADDEVVHSGRLFLGLEHQVHEYLSYVGGLEGLLNIEEPRASRFVFDNALRSTLSDSFKLELKARFMYEARPVVPGAKQLDTALILSLMYSVI
jgi:putative salt-induced outer membrane protein YdiY